MNPYLKDWQESANDAINCRVGGALVVSVVLVLFWSTGHVWPLAGLIWAVGLYVKASAAATRRDALYTTMTQYMLKRIEKVEAVINANDQSKTLTN